MSMKVYRGRVLLFVCLKSIVFSSVQSEFSRSGDRVIKGG